MSDIVIAGSGFAGCTAIRALRRLGYQDGITVVSPKAELFYYPSLIWVPAGRRTEDDLRVPLERFFAKQGVRHIAARATGLDARARVLRTTAGDLPYSDLLIASGGQYLRKLPGIEHAGIACAGWEEVKRYSDRLRALSGGHLAFGFAGNPNEPAAMRGGPVFEFLFGLDTLLRREKRRSHFELTFFSPAEKPGARLGDKAVERLLGEMRRRGIHTHLGHKLKAIEPGRVVTEGGEVKSDLTLFIPGMTGPDWARESGLALSEGGFFKGDAHCRAEGVEHVYVAGDAGSFPGPDWKPKQAHMADLQATCAVQNLLAARAGRPQTHTFRTEVVCIVDALNTGMLVYRDEKRGFQLKGKPLHWAKRWFESRYLRPYRKP